MSLEKDIKMWLGSYKEDVVTIDDVVENLPFVFINNGYTKSSDLADKVRGMKKNEYDYAIEDEDYVETFNKTCDELLKAIEE